MCGLGGGQTDEGRQVGSRIGLEVGNLKFYINNICLCDAGACVAERASKSVR